MRRAHNEDCFGILEDDGLVLVADGMGGHAAGEVASGLATTEVGSFYHRTHINGTAQEEFERQPTLSPIENRLVAGFRAANLRIFEAASGDQGRRGMGTTLVAAAFVGEQVCIAHVGDSRAYRIQDGEIVRLTRDHSLLEQFKEINPGMTREEENNFPHKNVITRALGLQENVEVDVKTYELKPKDMFILCSDGLSGQLTDEEMLEIARDAPNLPPVAAELIERANEAGGADNITLVIVQCVAS